jgi:uncharacterized membrane protein
MNTGLVLTLAFAIGLIAGLRSMTAPAVVSWAARLKWIDLQHSSLSFLGSSVAAYVLAVFAVGELIADKLPMTPSRTKPPGLIIRFVTGGLSGAALCAAANQSLLIGATLGGLGGLIGAFVGYQIRTRLARALKVPDFVIAVVEDAVAIAGGFFIASRFQI